MKATELMVGDKVFIAGSPTRTIKQLTSRKVGYITNDYETRVYYTHPEFVFGIPLTAEILEKNGFKYDGGEIWDIRWDDEDGHHCMNFRKMYRKSDGVWDSLGIMMGGEVTLIKSVHELQNALRVCGLNDLADNFKIE